MIDAPLARLLAAVEAGPLWPDDALVIPKPISAMINACFDDDRFCDFTMACDGSVNDAIALIKSTLPEWTAIELASRNAQSRWVAEVSREVDDVEERVVGRADAPARALLIATLRALVAQEGV